HRRDQSRSTFAAYTKARHTVTTEEPAISAKPSLGRLSTSLPSDATKTTATPRMHGAAKITHSEKHREPHHVCRIVGSVAHRRPIAGAFDADRGMSGHCPPIPAKRRPAVRRDVTARFDCSLRQGCRRDP